MDTYMYDNRRPVWSLLLLLLTSAVGTCTDRPHELAFSTFFGGSAGEMIRDVEVVRQGNVYVAGTTSGEDWPTKNACQNRLQGPSDALIAKLSLGPSAAQ